MRPGRIVLVLLLAALAGGQVWAQAVASQVRSPVAMPGLERWLLRLNEAARQRSYIGSFVVTAGAELSSSRIWHGVDGAQQLERLESLTGTPSNTFRRDDQVLSFFPESRSMLRETRDTPGRFPELLKRPDAALSRFYRLQALGPERVAGLLADGVQLVPLDAMRYAYRVWTEQKSGLMLKLQLLDAAGQVLEQVAFTELQLDAPVDLTRLKAMMNDTQGYQPSGPQRVEIRVEQVGWALSTSVPGFALLRCYRRLDAHGIAGHEPLQLVFSDGLASVSLFVEPFDAARHAHLQARQPLPMGATHLRVRHLGNWWLTAVGEVPGQTLEMFVEALERKR